MFYVYLLKSKKYSCLKIYIGVTNDLARRVGEHNLGMNTSTKFGIPWNLVYYEAYNAESDATAREKGLKKYGGSLGILKKKIAASLKNT